MAYELYHHGIKGQRWGIRRFQNKDGSLTQKGRSRYYDSTSKSETDRPEYPFMTKTGAKGVIRQHSQTKLAAFLNRISPKIAEESKKSLIYDIHNDNGQKIGDLQLYKEASNSMNVNWVGINTKQRGNGYASAVMKQAIEIAKSNGANQVTLEVPGNSRTLGISMKNWGSRRKRR